MRLLLGLLATTAVIVAADAPRELPDPPTPLPQKGDCRDSQTLVPSEDMGYLYRLYFCPNGAIIFWPERRLEPEDLGDPDAPRFES